MSQYKYDEEGGQFLTFVLTFLLLVLVPLTWSLLSGLTQRSELKLAVAWKIMLAEMADRKR